MLSELDRVIEEIRKDKGIEKEVLVHALETALVKAASNKYGYGLDIEAHYNEGLGEIELFQFKSVVENVKSVAKEISLEDGRKIDADAEMGDEIGVKLDAAQFGRIAAQTAKQVIMQNIREAERENIYNEYKDKKGDLVTGYVHRFDKGNIIVLLGRYESILPSQEQIPGETFSLRDRIKGYVLDIKKNAKGPQIIISRTHPGFLLKLFELEVPEVSDGIVKIHHVAREPGNRAKISVESFDSKVDPVGACVGSRGSRVQNIVHELHGERIDIIPWIEDSAKFVCAALSPAEVSEIILDEDNNTMEIIVDDSQLSLAIGKKGQNVRLAAKLTNWRIDIISRSKYDEESNQHIEDLMSIPGIDKTTAETLMASGYLTVESVAAAEPDDLVDVFEIDKKRAKKIKAQAQAFIKSRVTDKDEEEDKDKDENENDDEGIDNDEDKDKDDKTV